MNTAPGGRAPRLVILLSLLCILPGRSHAAAPDDVYFSAHSVQNYKYGPFVDDFDIWNDATYAGTSLSATAAHDTTDLVSTTVMSTVVEADAGVFVADLAGEITAQLRVGLFHQTYNNLDVSVYIHGPTGTAYGITMDLDTELQASRVGGLDGSLQSVNGVSTAALEESTLTVGNGGIQSRTWNRVQLFSGTTTTQILVNGETYSLARTLNLNSYTSVTQAYCILGCMVAAADFHALSSGHYRISVYPGGVPSNVGDIPSPAMTVTASPNPWRESTVVSFQAPAGTPTTVDVFDVRGRHVASLFDAPATGDTQLLPFSAANLASGVYFVRAQGGRVSSTKKLMLLK